jgi:hypothetical protein
MKLAGESQPSDRPEVKLLRAEVNAVFDANLDKIFINLLGDGIQDLADQTDIFLGGMIQYDICGEEHDHSRALPTIGLLSCRETIDGQEISDDEENPDDRVLIAFDGYVYEIGSNGIEYYDYSEEVVPKAEINDLRSYLRPGIVMWQRQTSIDVIDKFVGYDELTNSQ